MANLSWNSEQVELLASAMKSINQMVSEKVEAFQKDVNFFKSEEAFGTPGGGDPSQHLDIIEEFFMVLANGIDKIVQNTNQVNTNINTVLEIAKISISTNFKNSEEAKTALVNASKKSVAQ